jgi:hypothetical protein
MFSLCSPKAETMKPSLALRIAMKMRSGDHAALRLAASKSVTSPDSIESKNVAALAEGAYRKCQLLNY